MTAIDDSVLTRTAVGAYFFTLRECANLRQRDIVDAFRGRDAIARPTGKEIWTWEKGIVLPSARTLVALTEILSGSPEDIHALIRYDGAQLPLIRVALDDGDPATARHLAQLCVEQGTNFAWRRHRINANVLPNDIQDTTLYGDIKALELMLDMSQRHLVPFYDLFRLFAKFLMEQSEALEREHHRA